MSSALKSSFEFLASAQEWEERCQKEPANMDILPDAFNCFEEKRWTFPAHLLGTLMAFSEDKYEPYRQTLESLAKNGDSKGRVKGFPGYVKALPVGSLQDGQKQSKFSQWIDILYPTPELISDLPQGSLLIKINVELTSPFFSRDDQPFYPTENVLRRDSIFEVPMLSASSLKGLVHWAYRLEHKILEDNEEAKFIFGTIDENEVSKSTQGALHCYPVLWRGTVGLEVINPQNLETGSGKSPIKYEVLKKGGQGTLYFILVNSPVRPLKALHVQKFLSALDYLLKNGGLSAKSSCGWGQCKCLNLNAACVGKSTQFQAGKVTETTTATAQETVKNQIDKDAEAAWSLFVGEDGQLLPLSGNESIFTNKRIKDVLGSGCSNKMLKDKPTCYQKIQELFAKRQAENTAASSESSSEPQKPSTAWLWPGKGETDWSSFSTKVGSILQA